MPASSYVIGLDFGTDSVRALVVNALNGEELATSVFYYPRWKAGKFCDATKNQFRQHPLDYIEGIEHTIRDCVKNTHWLIRDHFGKLTFALQTQLWQLQNWG